MSLRLLALYFAMGPLEIYGRLRGVYRPRFGPLAHSVTNSPAKRAGPVVCFGDSLTEGFGSPRGASYPDELRRLGHFPGVEILNLGRSGDTSADGLARLDRDVLALNPLPRAVVVGFGGNDLIQRRPLSETFADLETIITRLHESGCVVVLLGLRGSWLYKVDFETPFRELAAATGCALVPLCLDGIWGYPWRMADVAHPNTRGYRLLARRVAQVLGGQL